MSIDRDRAPHIPGQPVTNPPEATEPSLEPGQIESLLNTDGVTENVPHSDDAVVNDYDNTKMSAMKPILTAPEDTATMLENMPPTEHTVIPPLRNRDYRAPLLLEPDPKKRGRGKWFAFGGAVAAIAAGAGTLIATGGNSETETAPTAPAVADPNPGTSPRPEVTDPVVVPPPVTEPQLSSPETLPPTSPESSVLTAEKLYTSEINTEADFTTAMDRYAETWTEALDTYNASLIRGVYNDQLVGVNTPNATEAIAEIKEYRDYFEPRYNQKYYYKKSYVIQPGTFSISGSGDSATVSGVAQEATTSNYEGEDQTSYYDCSVYTLAKRGVPIESPNGELEIVNAWIIDSIVESPGSC